MKTFQNELDELKTQAVEGKDRRCSCAEVIYEVFTRR